MANNEDLFFLFGYSRTQQIIPPNVHSDSHGWIVGNDIVGNNTLFRAQWIQCSYKLSGSYGPAARYVYYFLALLSVVAHHKSW
jgi:hypothetical protein